MSRINQYYGNGTSIKEYKRRPHIFLFSPEDLDNEDVILAVENTPTYKRSKQMIDEIRRQSSGYKPEVKSDNDGAKNDAVQGVISFV